MKTKTSEPPERECKVMLKNDEMFLVVNSFSYIVALRYAT